MQEKREQEELAISIGEDGYYLLSQLDSPDTPQYLREIESIETLRQVWLQQYYVESSNDEKLTAIPTNIFEMQQLESLDLSWNGITEIPEEISR